VCIPRARRRTAELPVWRSDARASVRPSSPPLFNRRLDGRPWPVSVYPPPQPCTEKLVADWCWEGGGGDGKRVRATVCVGGWCMCVRVRPGPTGDDETAEFRSRPQSAPRHTYSAGRSTTTAQPHSPTTRPPPCTPRVFADRYLTVFIVINRNIVTALSVIFRSLSFVSLIPFTSSRFPVPRSLHTRPAFDRSAHSGGCRWYDNYRLRRIVGTPDTTRHQSGKSLKRFNGTSVAIISSKALVL